MKAYVRCNKLLASLEVNACSFYAIEAHASFSHHLKRFSLFKLQLWMATNPGYEDTEPILRSTWLVENQDLSTKRINDNVPEMCTLT